MAYVSVWYLPTAGTFPCLPSPCLLLPGEGIVGTARKLAAFRRWGCREGHESFTVLLGAAGLHRGGGREERE